MPKKNTHPKMHLVQVQLTDGTTIETYSTSNISNLTLHADPHNHPAWTGRTELNLGVGKAAKFRTKMNI